MSHSSKGSGPRSEVWSWIQARKLFSAFRSSQIWAFHLGPMTEMWPAIHFGLRCGFVPGVRLFSVAACMHLCTQDSSLFLATGNPLEFPLSPQPPGFWLSVPKIPSVPWIQFLLHSRCLLSWSFILTLHQKDLPSSHLHESSWGYAELQAGGVS